MNEYVRLHRQAQRYVLKGALMDKNTGKTFTEKTAKL